MVWGAYQGAILCVNRLWDHTVGVLPGYARIIANPIINFLRRPLTFFWICIGWVFFRADTLGLAFQMFGSLFDFSKPLLAGIGLAGLPGPLVLTTPSIVLIGAAALVVSGWVWSVSQQPVTRALQPVTARLQAVWLTNANSFVLRPATYVLGLSLLLFWPPHEAVKFIYFQF
jgi:hypothetical protein